MAFMIAQPGIGDEIILNESNPSFVSGDFNCSTIHSATTGSLPISPSSGKVTAGELWQFFKRQGIHKMDKLVLNLDVDPLDGSDTNFAAIVIEIRNAADPSIVDKFSLDVDKRLVLAGYEASAFRSEAQLSIDLGYDFMTRYSKNSTDEVVLNVEMGDSSGVVPTFSFTGQSNWFSGFNVFLLAMFTGFWIIVFVVLFKLTNPNRGSRLPHDRQRVLSA